MVIRVSRKEEREEYSEKFLQKKPELSIYVASEYPPQRHSLTQCVNMHQEAAQPAMYNRLHALVYADMDLSLTTKKRVR